jgi:hypothetical protein
VCAGTCLEAQVVADLQHVCLQPWRGVAVKARGD